MDILVFFNHFWGFKGFHSLSHGSSSSGGGGGGSSSALAAALSLNSQLSLSAHSPHLAAAAAAAAVVAQQQQVIMIHYHFWVEKCCFVRYFCTEIRNKCLYLNLWFSNIIQYSIIISKAT